MMEDERATHVGTHLSPSRDFLTPKVGAPLTSGPPPVRSPKSHCTARSCFLRHEALPQLWLPSLPGNDHAAHCHHLPRVPPRPKPSHSLSSVFVEESSLGLANAHDQVTSSDENHDMKSLSNDENAEPAGDIMKHRLDPSSDPSVKLFRLQLKSDESTRRALATCYFLPVSSTVTLESESVKF